MKKNELRLTVYWSLTEAHSDGWYSKGEGICCAEGFVRSSL